MSSFHLYIVRINFTQIISKLDFFNKLKEQNINLNCHYIPIHLQPYYQKLGFKTGDFPASEIYYKEAVTLPLYPLLLEDQISYIADKINEIIK